MGAQEGDGTKSPEAVLARHASQALKNAIAPLTNLGDLAVVGPVDADTPVLKRLKEGKDRVRLLAAEVRDVRRRVEALADDLDSAS
jgi:hypothetical protein